VVSGLRRFCEGGESILRGGHFKQENVLFFWIYFGGIFSLISSSILIST
jgi:hypothetical protein